MHAFIQRYEQQRNEQKRKRQKNQPTNKRGNTQSALNTATAAQLVIAVHKYVECDEQLRIDSHRSHSHSQSHMLIHSFSFSFSQSCTHRTNERTCVQYKRVINFIILVFIIIECNPFVATNTMRKRKKAIDVENENLTRTRGYILDTFSTLILT